MKRARSELSNMPDNIIDSILACLPLRDAVKTSALSREWKHKWRCVPELVFDDSLFKPIHEPKTILHRVLLQHQGNRVIKFSVKLIGTNIGSVDVDGWLSLLPPSKLQDFTLHLLCNSKYGLPPAFFAFQNLAHLSLYRCVFHPPPHFRGFSSLVALDFYNVEFVPAVFAEFLSRCTLLETLRLVCCTALDSFELEGPCLRVFTFYGEFKTIRFKNSPLLAQLSLSTTTVDNGLKSFQLLPSLEKLHLHPRVLELFDAGRWSSTQCLSSLKYLNMSMYLDSVNEVTCALALLRSSPQLQTLHVSLYATPTVEAVAQFIRDQDTPDPHLNRLRKVEISPFSKIEPQIEFVRYILASAAGLEELVIASAQTTSDSRLMDVLKKFPCASPNVLFVVRG